MRWLTTESVHVSPLAIFGVSCLGWWGRAAWDYFKGSDQ